MSRSFNLYYSPDKLDLDTLSFSRPNMSYEFDIYLFAKTRDGQVYSCQDSGCSCPSPFENYNGTTAKDVIQRMERVGNYEDAKQQLRYWATNYSSWLRKPNGCWLEDHHYQSLKDWFPEEPNYTIQWD